MIRHLLVFLFCISAQPAFALEGVVYERGTLKRLENVNVFILPHKLKATTDSNGQFKFEDVPEGEFEWIINLTGYNKYQREDNYNSQDRTVEIYLERASYMGFETTVYGKQQKRDDTTRVLKAEKIKSLPGAGGDPVKAVQNLPGVNRANGFSSQVVIQGSAPEDTKYMIDGHEVPSIFHFGGLNSVVFSEAVDRVEYLSAGYGPERSRAIGGHVGVYTRDPRPDRYRGIGYLDIFNAGALIEGPLGDKGSFFFSARRSYIGEVLGVVFEDNDDFDLTVAPNYWDINTLGMYPVTEQDNVRLLISAAKDELEFVLDDPVTEDPDLRGNFRNERTYWRVIPQWERKVDETATVTMSLGYGEDSILADVGDSFFYLESEQLTALGEYEKDINKYWKTFTGFDNVYQQATVELELPDFFSDGGVGNPISTGETVRRDVYAKFNEVGLYHRTRYSFPNSPWIVEPGLRLDRYSATDENHLTPRLATRYKLDDYTALRFATGQYFQAPEPQELDEDLGNPDLESIEAWHYSLGIEKDFRRGSDTGFDVSAGVFYKTLRNIVIDSSSFTEDDGDIVPERYNNEGTGRIYGFETLIKLNLYRFEGWLIYTLSESLRSEPGQEEYPSEFDQTHNLNMILSYEFPQNWKAAIRARYVTGNPETPVEDAVFDSDNDVYVPVRGDFYSTRKKDFFQVDLRVDKKWIYDTWILSMYLDIQNVTNYENVESTNYSYDYSEKEDITGLPILPTFGFKGEF